jgi:hypothetical protein
MSLRGTHILRRVQVPYHFHPQEFRYPGRSHDSLESLSKDEGMPEVRIARSVVGVLFGFGVFFAIVRMLSATFGNSLYLSVGWTIVASVLGGYIAARIAGAHEFPHAAAVGMLMIALSFLSMREEGVSRPGWYQITIAGCGPISALIGAAIRLLTKPRQDPQT